MGFSRANGTILFHSCPPFSVPIPVDVSASDILGSYDRILYDTTTLGRPNATTSPTLFSSSQFAAFLWLSKPAFDTKNAVNPATSMGVYSILQSVLVIPLYICQPGVARRLLPEILDDRKVDPALFTLLDLLSPLPEPTTQAYFAYLRYDVKASNPTLFAYAVLSTAALLLCVTAQVAASAWRSSNSTEDRVESDDTNTPSSDSDRVTVVRGAARVHLSSFPVFDLLAHCIIEDDCRPGTAVFYQRPWVHGRNSHVWAGEGSLVSRLANVTVSIARHSTAARVTRLEPPFTAVASSSRSQHFGKTPGSVGSEDAEWSYPTSQQIEMSWTNPRPAPPAPNPREQWPLRDTSPAPSPREQWPLRDPPPADTHELILYRYGERSDRGRGRIGEAFVPAWSTESAKDISPGGFI